MEQRPSGKQTGSGLTNGDICQSTLACKLIFKNIKLYKNLYTSRVGVTAAGNYSVPDCGEGKVGGGEGRRGGGGEGRGGGEEGGREGGEGRGVRGGEGRGVRGGEGRANVQFCHVAVHSVQS